MTDFTTMDNDSLGADKIARTATAVALYDNPIAIAERGTDAPIVQVAVREWKTSGTGTTWTIPAGVTAFTIYVGGGCGGNGGTPAASTVTYNGVTYTGNPGANCPSSGEGGAGGTATGGDRNITGQRGGNGHPSTYGGAGGQRAIWGGNGAQGADASFPNDAKGGGGGGGMCVKRIVVAAGVTTATYTVGAGGTGADGGLIVFEY